MKKIIYLSIVLFISGIAMLSFRAETPESKKPTAPVKDSVGSVKAFMSVYKVLMSPRCMNCHPAGDAPLQGDDNRLHTMNVKRGADGHGLYAVRCSNCHQLENEPGLHMPPGNPKWGLPPANMRMVFQGRTPRQLALQLLNPKQNGGRTQAQLIDHMANDALVGWGWHPGDGRTLPPMSRSAFVAQVRSWIAKGAYAPAAKAK
jgi:mono/diheme cytochrome c family protein